MIPALARSLGFSKHTFGPARQGFRFVASGNLDDQILIPMPKLSHQMTDGTITKWLKSEGDTVGTYDLLFEVSTDSLTEEAYKDGDFAGTVTLSIESQEDVYLAKILHGEGSKVTVGTPVAIAYDTKEQAQLAGTHTPAVSDVYTGDQGGRVLVWQSFLKKSNRAEGGCM